MEFKEQKLLITRALVRNDIKKISERVGSSAQTVRSTLKLDSLSGATDLQIRIWNECLSLLNERQKKAEAVESRVAKLAETLS